MNGLPYYKAYPRDFIEGTIGMPLEVKGAYRILIDLIYMHGGKVPDDGQSHCRRYWGARFASGTALETALIKAGKIRIVDGMISQ